jgi:hypothetical protein
MTYAGLLRPAGAILLMLAVVVAPTHAHEPVAATDTAGKGHAGPPTHPISLIEGSRGAWTVSRTETGCFLLSASRAKASRLAIGWNPALGLGLFAVDFALAVHGPDAVEPVDVKLDDGEVRRAGRMAGASLLLVPLSQQDVDSALRTLTADGTLWLRIRSTWLAHGGQNVKAAIADYTKQCTEAPKAPAAPLAVAPAAKIGSKAASAP